MFCIYSLLVINMYYVLVLCLYSLQLLNIYSLLLLNNHYLLHYKTARLSFLIHLYEHEHLKEIHKHLWLVYILWPKPICDMAIVWGKVRNLTKTCFESNAWSLAEQNSLDAMKWLWSNLRSQFSDCCPQVSKLKFL